VPGSIPKILITKLKLRLFINLTPFTLPRRAYPPLLKRRGGSPSYGRIERGEAPLLLTLPLPLIREGGQGDRLLHSLKLPVMEKGRE